MRIISGTHKGRVLKAPSGLGLRPTSDRLRETLFNILAPRMPDARVLDLFAGTGAVALEALSRGARLAVCVESDRKAEALIRENRERLGEEKRCIILRDDVVRALGSPVTGGPFEIVFLDPPYDHQSLGDLVTAARRQVAPAGVLVLEHASRREPPATPALRPDRSVRAGDSTLTFYS
jgi:16S rRNA (guanine(966)-N(2))-methyltransferase RsmD